MRARGSLVGLLVLGVGLVAAPAMFQMWSRGPKGAEMLDEFRPYMTDQKLGSFQGYMDEIDAAVGETDRELRPFLAARAGIDRSAFDTRFAEFRDFTAEWPGIDADMTDLLVKVRANVDNYRAVDALPPFDLFPWFFVLPGAVITIAACVALVRPRAGTAALWVVVALGIGLVVAPFAFRMFSRAPAGGEMMDDFTTIETRARVQTIQGYFSAMAVGEGSIRLGIYPALQAVGLSDAQIAEEFPAVARLHDNWIEIINEMTPMIGAMSDNVDNYEAVQSLPPFPLFPFFFALPGGIAAVLAAFALRARSRPMTRRHHLRAAAATGTIALVLLATSGLAGAAAAQSGKTKKLVGTFELTPGTCDAGGVASGSYFRMVLSGGNLADGPFFANPDSACSDKTYIPAAPGTDGGLVTGTYQPRPDPPFDATGNSLADGIIEPQSFTAIDFSVSTNPTDPQSGDKVPKPTIRVKGKKLTGDVRAITASWNKEDFNQGSPKSDGSKPGLTKAVTGTYAPKTDEFTLEWASQIEGGPFNGFTGVWHWEGTFSAK